MLDDLIETTAIGTLFDGAYPDSITALLNASHSLGLVALSFREASGP